MLPVKFQASYLTNIATSWSSTLQYRRKVGVLPTKDAKRSSFSFKGDTERA